MSASAEGRGGEEGDPEGSPSSLPPSSESSYLSHITKITTTKTTATHLHAHPKHTSPQPLHDPQIVGATCG